MKLKPCPFCGGEAKWYETESSKYPYQIVCTQCYCGTDEMTYKEDAIDRWNRREPIDKIVEQLEDYKTWKEFMTYDLTHRELKIITRAIEIVKSGGQNEN